MLQGTHPSFCTWSPAFSMVWVRFRLKARHIRDVGVSWIQGLGGRSPRLYLLIFENTRRYHELRRFRDDLEEDSDLELDTGATRGSSLCVFFEPRDKCSEGRDDHAQDRIYIVLDGRFRESSSSLACPGIPAYLARCNLLRFCFDSGNDSP